MSYPPRRHIDTEVEHHDAAVEQDHMVVDSPATRNAGLIKLTQAIYLLFGIIEALIGIRFLLLAFGANAAAPFVGAIYTITAPFIAPFAGIFGTPQFNGSVIEPHSIVAIIMYALLAWVLVKIAWIMMADTRDDVHTTTRSVRSEHDLDDHDVDHRHVA
jgi:hypothetical protein